MVCVTDLELLWSQFSRGRHPRPNRQLTDAGAEAGRGGELRHGRRHAAPLTLINEGGGDSGGKGLHVRIRFGRPEVGLILCLGR